MLVSNIFFGYKYDVFHVEIRVVSFKLLPRTFSPYFCVDFHSNLTVILQNNTVHLTEHFTRPADAGKTTFDWLK